LYTTARSAEGEFEQVNRVLAGQPRDLPPATVREGTVTDTDEVLGAAGYTNEEIAAMRREGVAA
jgi:hypothetical protein